MKKFKRLLAALLAGVMVAGMSTTAFAEEGNTYEPENAYVLNYEGGENYKWQYFSPYWSQFDVGDSDGYSMISFTLKKQGTEEYFPTYCVDIFTGLDSSQDAIYRRLNLEDSTYFDLTTSRKLRSVFLSGYPQVELVELAKNAGVESLTVGEAVSATQMAIWEIAHGDRIEVTDYCYWFDTEWSPTATKHYDECNAEIESGYASEANEAKIEDNIKALYEYLISLDGTAPQGVAVSDATFDSFEVTRTDNGDGTCDVTVAVTADITKIESDNLILTAILGDNSEYILSETLINGKNKITLTFDNVPVAVLNDEVKLAIDGTQTVGDVYLFDVEGNRGTTQSLIGYSNTQLPVHAEISTNDRVLEIHKTAENGTTALKNITFDIYYVCTAEEYINGDKVIGTGKTVDGVEYFSAPTTEDITKYVTGRTPEITITTGENGIASYNFGTDNDGIYIVVERNNAVTTGAVEPFFVAIPGGEYADNRAGEYKVIVKPKNTVIKEDVEIEKDVTDIDNNKSSYDVGENHTWIIQSSIPAGLSTGVKYEVADTLDKRLTLVSVDKVAVAFDNGIFGVETEEQIKDKTEDAKDTEKLVLGKHDYTVTIQKATETTTDQFTVSLTTVGMKKVAEYIEEVEGKCEDYEIRIYFTAFINGNAAVSEEIPNQATVEYENNVGSVYDAESDEPVVYTCGVELYKHDAKTNVPLKGAVFKLAEEVSKETEGASQLATKEGTIYVIYKEFCATPDLTDEKVTEVTTDREGKAYLYGLEDGIYYLVETQAPAGYNLLSYPLQVVMNQSSHATAIEVANSNAFKLPATGGIGTGIFTLVGAALTLGSGAVLVGKKKKEEEE